MTVKLDATIHVHSVVMQRGTMKGVIGVVIESGDDFSAQINLNPTAARDLAQRLIDAAAHADREPEGT